MSWILVALIGYFFNAVAAVLDKYLLSGPIKTPAAYAFFVSLFSLFTVFFIPFGFQMTEASVTFIFFLSGGLFLYGLVAMYTAVQEQAISRVAPLVGTTVSLVAFGVALLVPGTLAEATFSFLHIVALLLLIGGGLLISFDLPLRKREHISPYVFIAGMLMGASLLLLKYGYEHGQTGFISGLVLSRGGMFLAGLTLLLVPKFRHQIFGGARETTVPSRKNVHTGVFFVVNKVCAGLATFLIVYATSIGPVSFVQALSGMQYVFLLLLALPLSLYLPRVFGERLSFWDWFQKVCAIILIGLGLWLLATSGISLILI